MLSLVLYGRNDSYGYNLHKRAALSLNCMSEVLTDPDDEVLFVDYNTPDDFPTFPEAIIDTLSEKVRQKLRVFRVRPAVHQERFAHKTHLKALEGVSRNVAIRRSNDANKWILSTNTDMIFVPLDGSYDLTSSLRDLDAAHYCAPRMEIPETLWESFDRYNATKVIEDTRDWGNASHLNEIVYGARNILFDAPGDFQLIKRSLVFDIQGFHEDMLLGWHLDSNMSKRLTLAHGPVSDASDRVFGYHCDHTRQITPMHSHKSTENSIADYVDNVVEPTLPEQAGDWGLGDLDVEELSINNTRTEAYKRMLRHTLEPMSAPTKAYYSMESYGKQAASADHILPFLLDLFVNSPTNFNVVWIGEDNGLATQFKSFWHEAGFTGSCFTPQTDEELIQALDKADAIIVNFGVPDLVTDDKEIAILKSFQIAVTHEQNRLERDQGSYRRIVGVNCIHNKFEAIIKYYVGCARTPFSTRLRHGFLLSRDPITSIDFLPDMRINSGVQKTKAGFRCDANTHGFVVFGPYTRLPMGEYVIEVSYQIDLPWTKRLLRKKQNDIVIELVFNEVVMSEVALPQKLTGKQSVSIPIAIDVGKMFQALQVRFRKMQRAELQISSIWLHRLK